MPADNAAHCLTNSLLLMLPAFRPIENVVYTNLIKKPAIFQFPERNRKPAATSSGNMYNESFIPSSGTAKAENTMNPMADPARSEL